MLRRLGPTAVVPREEGIEGWVWTSRGGSALPALGDEDDAPNGLLLFAKPLAGELVSPRLRARVGARRWPTARRSASPVVAGLLLRLADTPARPSVLPRGTGSPAR